MNQSVVNNGGRAFFGFDANARTCGKYKFPGDSGNMTTISMFYAAKTSFNHPVLGNMKANNKHLAIVVRNSTHSLYRCLYVGSPPGSSPSPTPTNSPILVSPTSSPSASGSHSPSPSASISPGASVSPSTSVTASHSNSQVLAVEPPSLSDGSLVDATGSKKPSGGSTCFPAEESVRLYDGSVTTMEKLALGDRVLVAKPSTYSTVFMFTHRIDKGLYEFCQFTLEDGSVIRMTPTHYTYVDGKILSARDVRVGHKLDSKRVAKVELTFERGLYNPQTVSGDIVVNGVRTTTFTETVVVSLAQSLLSPFRCLYKLVGFKFNCLEGGWNNAILQASI